MKRIRSRTVVGALLLGCFVTLSAMPSRELAANRYKRAETLLQDLEAVPKVELGERQYLLVIDALKSVHRASPASSYCDDALIGVGDVYTAMIDRFGPDPWREKAIEAYKFVIQEYPHSPLLDQARKALRGLEGGASGSTLSQARRQASEPEPEPEAKAETKPEPAPEKAPAPAAQPAPPPARPSTPMRTAPADAIVRSVSVTTPPAAFESRAAPTPDSLRGGVASISAIRHYTHPGYTRIVIDADDYTPYKFDFLSRPRRLYFDLLSARMSGAIRRGVTIEVGDAQVARIRAAQNRLNKARVVLDLTDDVYYDISWIPNPPRLVIDLRGHKTVQQMLARGEKPELALPEPEYSQQPGGEESLAQDVDGRVPTPAQQAPAEAAPAPAEQVAQAPAEPVVEARNEPAPAAKPEPAPEKPKSFEEAFLALTAGRRQQPPAARALDSGGEPAPAQPAARAELQPSALPSVSKGAVPPPEPPPAEVKLAKAVMPAASAPGPADDMPPPRPAEATSRGNQNLIRALGLKIGRVVIDAGHGGHDPGNIGPTGLQEKDVVLDISLRLGKLIEEQLGAEVIYTRTDDRFLDLRERPKVANEAQADLFVSVHANAYKSPSVRGVETFYLNFTADPWALKVASRENAASTHSVHELQDLLGKIALKEKIEESREFATRMQTAVHSGLSKEVAGLRNRGVRAAPFIVLIGAKMPAILAEIGFLSNPADEKLFKSGKYRDTVAEQLFNGIESYVKSLGSHSLTMTDTETASASLD